MLYEAKSGSVIKEIYCMNMWTFLAGICNFIAGLISTIFWRKTCCIFLESKEYQGWWVNAMKIWFIKQIILIGSSIVNMQGTNCPLVLHYIIMVDYTCKTNGLLVFSFCLCFLAWNPLLSLLSYPAEGFHLTITIAAVLLTYSTLQ